MAKRFYQLGANDVVEQPYPFVEASVSEGTLTLQNAANQTYTPTTSNDTIQIAAPTDTLAMAHDMVLVLDLSSASSFTLSWESLDSPVTHKFHPRTNAATDLGCTLNKVNVYYISEYMPGHYVVSRYVEVAAATSGGA